MEMSIAQALVYKKRVIEALAKYSSDVQTYNSVAVYDPQLPSRDGVDVAQLVEKRKILKEHLVALKLKLWDASRDIRENILKIAELKDDATFWASVSTKSGTSKERYETEAVAYDAVFNKQQIDKVLSEIKKMIDKLQSTIDTFNYTHTVSIDEIEL